MLFGIEWKSSLTYCEQVLVCGIVGLDKTIDSCKSMVRSRQVQKIANLK